MKKQIIVVGLALMGAFSTAGAATSQQSVAPAQRVAFDCKKPTCSNCGRVMGVRSRQQEGKSNALGVVGGGAAGALLGNQVGSGSGRTLATIAGAVGGAYAGKHIQERSNRSTVWTVDVQYDNGRKGSFTYDHNPGVQRGDRVKKQGQNLVRM